MRSMDLAFVAFVAALGFSAANAAVADGRSAAAQSLLESAQQSLTSGQPEQASILIERALRIDPGNPSLWHYLSVARRELGDTAQADAMAAKSRNLAGAERSLSARNTAPSSNSAPRADDGARTWSFRNWFGTKREPSVSYRNTRPSVAPRGAARSDGAATNEYCEVWTFDERGRRQSWIMKCDDAQRYAARGGSAVMIKTRAAEPRYQAPSATQQ